MVVKAVEGFSKQIEYLPNSANTTKVEVKEDTDQTPTTNKGSFHVEACFINHIVDDQEP